MLPLLLTNAGFRRSLTSGLRDPLALEPFWAWYDNLTDGERAQAIAPLMNKLRQWLLRPSLRAVLGQREPRFQLRQVFTERKILLVPLRKAILGPEAAGLLGSLVVAQLWQAIQARAAIPAEQAAPGHGLHRRGAGLPAPADRPRRRPGPGARLRGRLHPGAPVPRPTAAADARRRAQQRPLPGLLPAQPARTPCSWPRAIPNSAPRTSPRSASTRCMPACSPAARSRPYASGVTLPPSAADQPTRQRLKRLSRRALRPAAG